jgi:uncharacterized damage-inducible protein DinB
MKITEQIAKHLREFYFGGNWTGVNLKDTLTGVDWQQATTKIQSFNTIASLVYHIHYYIHAILNVFKGSPLDAHDKYSFDLPSIQSAEDWETLLARTRTDAEELAKFVEQLPDEKLNENFAGGQYGSYYRNLAGSIEHAHYHLGQIVLLKKYLAAHQVNGLGQ